MLKIIMNVISNDVLTLRVNFSINNKQIIIQMTVNMRIMQGIFKRFFSMLSILALG